jgi:transcriptional regulator with XRE-family HTH domain
MKNPLKELMKKRGWTYADLSSVGQVSMSTIYKIREGESKKIHKNIINLVEAIGEDPEKFKKDYREFRKDKRKRLLRQ